MSEHLKAMSIGSYSFLLRKLLGQSLLFLEICQIVQDTLISIVQEAESKCITIGTNIPVFDSNDDASHASELSDEEDETLASIVQSQVNSPSNGNYEPSFGQLITESSNLVYSVSEAIHAKLSKLIVVRIEQNSLLNVRDFFWMYNIFGVFMKYGEERSQRSVFVLKGTLLTQSKAYLKHFHDSKTKQLTMMIESESWNQAEVPFDFQMIAQQITAHSLVADKFNISNENISTIESNSNEDLDYSPNVDISSSDFDLNCSFNGKGNSCMINSTGKKLIIEEQSYYAVVSVLIFLKTLVDYLQCADVVLMTELINRIIDILKVPIA